jgi:hypothetical protein
VLHPEFIQRTISTPHSSGFARFEFEFFSLPSQFFENNKFGEEIPHLSIWILLAQ